MTSDVATADMNRTVAHPPNTKCRASLTPVRSATVTKIFSGTRERAERVARCSSEIIEERSMPIVYEINQGRLTHNIYCHELTLNGVIHANAGFKYTERPKSLTDVCSCYGINEGNGGNCGD